MTLWGMRWREGWKRMSWGVGRHVCEESSGMSLPEVQPNSRALPLPARSGGKAAAPPGLWAGQYVISLPQANSSSGELAPGCRNPGTQERPRL